MPKQSLLVMKVAFGARAQYATILALSLLMVTQIIGVAIFSGTSRASSTAVFVRSLPSGAQPKALYAGFRNYDSGIAEGPDNYLYAVTGGQAVYKLDQNGAYVSTITLSSTIYAKDIVVSSSGDFYVLENNDSGSNQNSIKKFNSSGVYQGLVVGYNTFDTMRQIAINASDELYTIGSSTTKKYNTSGLQLGSWSVGGYRLAIDGNYVYSTYNGCFVRKLDTTTGVTTTFGGCGTADGQFNNTGGLDVDASGNVYVADMSADRVQVFDATGVYQSSFGSNGMGDGQLMTSMLGYKNDVMVVGNGTVLVGDQFSNRIQVFNLAGTYVRELRDAYAAPAAMAIGSSGAMYVVDMHNSRIKKIDKGTGAVLAQWGSYGSGNGQFKFDTYAYMYKTGIAVDSQENVYVVDTDNHRIQKFTSAGVYVTQWGSDGLGVGQFDVVSDIAIDSSDQVYTLETGYQMYRVQRFDTNGQNAVSIGATNQFNEPRALAVAADRTLYVADTTGSSPRIQVFTSAGSFDHNIAPGASVGEFNSMTVDGRGNLLVGNYNFVSGINSIHRVSTQGTFTTEALLGITTGTGDGQLWGVSGLTADKLGNFYASDTQGRIQMFYNANSVPVNVVTRAASNIDLTAARLNLQTSDLLDKAVATYSFEYGATTSYGSTAASSGIAAAQSSTVSLTGGPTISHAGSNQYQDRSGNLYINPTGNLYKYSSSGQYLGQIGASGNFYGGNYANFAFDSQDNIYYTEDGIGVQKYAANGTSLGSISGAPTGINRLATDNSDNVYVMTSTSVYKYSSAGNLLNQFALPEAANMICGSGMVVDSAGYMYVLDAADCGVGGTPGGVMRKYTPDWQYVTEWVSPTTYNLYIDANDVIYVYGRTLFTTSGSTVTSTGPLWTSGGGSYDALNKLMGVDVATGTVYAMSNYDTSVSTYASQGYANISGLTCGTTYHFRAKAVVGSDTVYGADQTFTTGACAVPSPNVATTNVSGELASRTMHGTYTPPAGVTEYGFEFGLTTSYGQQLLNDSAAYSHSLNRQWGSAGSDDGQFGSAAYSGVAIEADSAGNSYVLDAQNNRIQKFNAQGDFVLKWGSAGGGDYDMTQARDMAINSSGNILVLYASPSVVREYTPGGVYVSSWSVPSYYPYSNSHLDIGDDGSVYILYAGGLNYYDLVRKFTPIGVNTGVVWSVGANAASDLTVTSNRVYVLTGSKQISEFDLEGTAIATHTNFPDQVYCGGSCTNVYTMNRITSDSDGYIYASSWLVGRKYDQSFNIVSEWESGDRYGIAVSKDLGYIYSLGGNSLNAVVRQYAPAITATVGSLQCGTDYHYRAYAINSGGIGYGQDATFTTESCASITTSDLGVGYENYSYTDQIQATNTHGGNTYSLTSGSLPAGLTLDSNSGVVSGTPEYGTGGNYTFSVTLSDVMGDTTKVINLYIMPHDPLQIATSSLDNGRVGVAYSDSLSIYTNLGPAAAQVISGNLPPGITMDVTGAFSGTPTQDGVYNFRVSVSDLLDTVEKDLSIEVLPAYEIPVNTPIVTITSPGNNTSFDYQHDTVTIAGTGPANQLITTFMDGQQLGTATVNGAGNWQYTVSNVFPGNHSFDAKWIPVGDLALIPSVDFDVSSGGTGITTSTLSLVDTASMETAKVVYLPETILVTASVINHAGTKGYVVGFDADTASAFYEIDIATGAITKATNLQFDQTIYGELFISDDDTTGYLLGASEQNVGYYSAVSVNLANLTMDGNSAVAIPFSDGVSGQAVARAMVSSTYYNGFIYNPESNGDNDPDSQTATAVSLSTGAATQIPLLSEPRWVGCHPRADVAGGKVYFISNNKLSVVDPITNTVIKTITVAGITDYHTCATGITIDPVHQRAFVYMTDDGNNGGGGLKAVDLVNETTTDVGDVPVDVFRAGVRSMIAEFYDRHHAELAQYLQDNPQPGIDINNLDPFYDMLTDSLVNGITQSDPGTKSFSAGDISSDGQRLYLATPYYGIYIAVDTASLQYVLAGGSFTFGYQVYFGGGNFVSHGVSPQASISFSVGQGPVAPPDDPPVIDPDPEDPPVVTDVTPAPATTKPSKSNPITAPQTVVATQNSLFALAKRIPEPLAVGFPWLLLLLALILVGMQYYQVHTEEVSTKRMQTSVAKQQRLVEEQNNFVALSTHYLHTPLTIMEGEISLMVKAGTITQQQATKLQATLTSLNAEAEAVLAQEEQNE